MTLNLSLRLIFNVICRSFFVFLNRLPYLWIKIWKEHTIDDRKLVYITIHHHEVPIRDYRLTFLTVSHHALPYENNTCCNYLSLITILNVNHHAYHSWSSNTNIWWPFNYNFYRKKTLVIDQQLPLVFRYLFSLFTNGNAEQFLVEKNN